MINQSGIRVEKAVNVDQILFNTELKVAVGVRIPQSMGVEDTDTGHKIVKAGTPIFFSLEARNTVAEAASTTGSGSTEVTKATGILQHDVDVTYGVGNGSALIFAFVNSDRLAASVKTLLTDKIKAAMPMITFLK